MANITVTYTFANSTTADATQVNQNFTDILNGTSDGTKDFSIANLTVAGTFTENGTVNLGNASSDDITITGSLGGSIPIKTTNTYDIGSATIGLRSIYLADAGSAARSTRILGGTVAASWTLTLPTAVGAIGKALFTTDASGATTWRYSDKVVTAQTGTYTVTGDETFVPCNASGGAFTVNLPAAASHSGKRVVIKKVDATHATNIVTIEGAGTETIDGALNTTLNSQYESVELLCDGSNWHIIDRNIPSVWTSYTPTFTGFGTETLDHAVWRRVDDSIELQVSVTTGMPTGVECRMSLPLGLTSAGSSKIGTLSLSGTGSYGGAGAVSLDVLMEQSVTYVTFGQQSGSTAGFSKGTGTNVFIPSTLHGIRAMVPINGWAG